MWTQSLTFNGIAALSDHYQTPSCWVDAYIMKHDSKKAVGHNITIPAQN